MGFVIPVKFARIYGMVYWGIFGILLAIVIPFVDKDVMGPNSPFGVVLQAFPDELTKEAVFFSHAWGIAMLTLLISNHVGIMETLVFIKVLAIITVLFLPVCGYCMVNGWGFFWKLTFPVLYLFNSYVYISAGWYSPEARDYAQVSN